MPRAGFASQEFVSQEGRMSCSGHGRTEVRSPAFSQPWRCASSVSESLDIYQNRFMDKKVETCLVHV
jgi:hypothetical protein